MKRTTGVAVVLILVVLAAWFAYSRSSRLAPPGSATTATPPGPTDLPARGEFGACDQQPQPPSLPETLAPASTDIAAIVAALDAALNDQHKAWLRCFTIDEELLARTQFGVGRWLRTTLRLRQAPALAALGAQAPDEASSLIVLVYAAHLRGQELSLDEARRRRKDAFANVGVAR